MVCTYTCEISLSQYFRLNSENTWIQTFMFLPGLFFISHRKCFSHVHTHTTNEPETAQQGNADLSQDPKTKKSYITHDMRRLWWQQVPKIPKCMFGGFKVLAVTSNHKLRVSQGLSGSLRSLRVSQGLSQGLSRYLKVRTNLKNTNSNVWLYKNTHRIERFDIAFVCLANHSITTTYNNANGFDFSWELKHVTRLHKCKLTQLCNPQQCKNKKVLVQCSMHFYKNIRSTR